jgi:hypothetical protein
MPPIHSTSLQFVAGLYVFAVLAGKGIVLFRGLKIRRSHFIGEPVWDWRDNSGDSLFMFLAATDWHPVGIVQIFVDEDRLQSLGLKLRDLAHYLESQPFIFAAFTNDDVRGATPAAKPVTPTRSRSKYN